MVICLAMSTALFVACNDLTDSGSASSSEQSPVGSITLSQESALMDLYETLTLTATLSDVEGEVAWSSSDTTKATVENGVVTSLAEGEVVITASIGEVKAECAITIESSGQIPSLSLNKETVSMRLGDDFAIVATLRFKGIELQAKYSYESSNTQVATVENGIITATGTGEANIIVTAEYNGFTATKVVAVDVKSNVLLDVDANVVVLGTIDTEEYDVSKQVNAIVTVGEEVLANPALAWASEDATVVTVENGLITAVGAGSTVVTVAYTHTTGEEFVVNVNVTVEKPVFEATLENAVIDLGEDKASEVEIDLAGIEQAKEDLVAVVNVTNYNAEVAFKLVDGKVVLERQNLTVGTIELSFEYALAIYVVEVKVTCDRYTLISYASEADVSKASIRWGTDLGASVDTNVKYGDEEGSLKLTFLANGANYMKFETMTLTDVSDYDYIIFNVLNATGRQFSITYLWTNHVNLPASDEWQEVRLPVKSIRDGNIKDYNDVPYSPTNIGGLAIYIDLNGHTPGSEFYFSSLRAEKAPKVEEPVAGPETHMNFDSSNDLLGLDKGGYTLSINKDAKYIYGEEAGSLKVTTANKTGDSAIVVTSPLNKDMSAYDAVAFRVYNTTDSAIMVGTWWAADTSCAPGQWTEVRITKEKINKGDVTGSSSMANVNELRIRFINGIPAGGVVYVSAVVGIYIEGETPENAVVNFDHVADLDKVSSGEYQLSIDKTIVYGEENGSLKVTAASKTGDTAITVTAPVNADMSEYDYVAFRVYNATESAIMVGTWWAADTACAPGKWTEIKLLPTMGLDGFSFANMANMKLRIISGLPAGGVIYISSVVGEKVEQEVIPENVVASFNTKNATNYVSLAWGDNHTMEWTNEVKAEGEAGSLKITCIKAKNNNYLKISNPHIKDISAYDYIELSIYNPTERDFGFSIAWAEGITAKAGQWTTLRVPVSSFVNGKVTDAWSGAPYSATNITNSHFYIDAANMELNDYFYVSSIKAVKENAQPEEPEQPEQPEQPEEPEQPEDGSQIVVDFDSEEDLARVDNGGYTLSIDTETVYGEEAGSLKVTTASKTGDSAITVTAPVNADMSAFDYVAFRVYNATESAIMVGTWWAADTNCAPGEWTEVKLLATMGLDGFSFENMANMKIRIISGLPAEGVIYISAVVGAKADTADANVIKEFHKNINDINLPSDHGSAEYTTEQKYGEEAGSLKLTTKKSSEVYIGINTSMIPDVSSYEYVVFRVYNPTESNIQVGLLWCADTVCKAGEWTDVKIPVATFAAGNAQNFAGNALSATNISGFVIRFIGGFATGDVFYISAIRAI